MALHSWSVIGLQHLTAAFLLFCVLCCLVSLVSFVSSHPLTTLSPPSHFSSFSKLTRLLQPTLSGNSLVSLVVNISPSSTEAGETVSFSCTVQPHLTPVTLRRYIHVLTSLLFCALVEFVVVWPPGENGWDRSLRPCEATGSTAKKTTLARAAATTGSTTTTTTTSPTTATWEPGRTVVVGTCASPGTGTPHVCTHPSLCSFFCSFFVPCAGEFVPLRPDSVRRLVAAAGERSNER